jgi:squalene-associated FAD-dependent desaturase
MNYDVVVVGAGLAGLSAAVRIADAGRRVLVLEEAPRLGGRATAFVDRESQERVDNGQHVMFGCYHETYTFLKDLGSAHLAPLQPRMTLTMAAADGRATELRCPSLPPPWHLIAGVLRWRALPLADRLRVVHLRGLLQEVRRDGAAAVAARVPAADTVASWLARHGQSRQICEWLWYPLAFAALNQSPAVAAARSFVRVLGELFGPRIEDSALGLPTVPLDELYAEPARCFIEARGGAVWTGAPARIITDDQYRVTGVRTPRGKVAAAAIVSAVPWFAFDRLWEGVVPRPLEATAANARAMKPSPIVTINLWFDGAAMAVPFVGLVGGPMHWVFDKSAIFGEHAGHLSVVASGADDLAAMDNATATRAAVEQLRGALPGIGARRLQRSVVVREHRATFSLAPNEPARPDVRTGVDGFYLAGDWTDTGLPATIEGAVKSGHVAAEAIVGPRPLQLPVL